MGIPGRIHSLESFGTLDGPGIRFVVFLQGCRLRCKYCHNPDSWSCSGGTEMSVPELMKKIGSCRNFLRNGGVTLSGGEPLLQPDFVLEFLHACRAEGLHTAIDTAGSVPLESSADVLNAADLILLDIKALDEALCRDLTGSGNRNELETLAYCESIGKPVWIRHVLVPGWTLIPERLQALADYLRPFHCVRRIDLLPFHKMASFKWEALGIPDPFADLPEPDSKSVALAESIFAPLNRSGK